MKTIAQQLNIKEFPFQIEDKNGNTIYFENSDGDWVKWEYNLGGNVIYCEASNGYIEDNRPKPCVDKVVEIDGIKTPIAAANWLYQQGYRKLHMVVGEDRVAAMTDLMNGWNSDAVRSKDGRDAVEISVSSAGDRDPDSEGLSGISGTKARAAVTDGDRQAFEKATGLAELRRCCRSTRRPRSWPRCAPASAAPASCSATRTPRRSGSRTTT
jgi:hypothetical protein